MLDAFSRDEPFLPQPLRPIVTSPVASASYASAGGQWDRQVQAGFGAPLVDGDRLTLVGTLNYQLNTLELSQLSASASAPTNATLHRFELRTLGVFAVAERWNVVFDLRGIYAGQLDSAQPAAWQPFLRVNVGYALGKRISLYGGAVLVRTNLGLIPLPSLGLVYRSVNRDWMLTAIPPRRIELRYTVSPSTAVYVMAGFDPNVWLFEQRDGQSAFLSRNRIRSALGARRYLFDAFAVEVELGITALQQVEALTLGSDSIDSHTETLGLFSALRLVRGDPESLR